MECCFVVIAGTSADPETRGPYCWRCNDDPYEQIWSEDGNTLISESLCVCQTV